MKKRILITDLDNTLYDWVSFFSSSFEKMLIKTNEITGISISTLIDDFKEIHNKHKNSEHPFALLEIKSIRNKYPNKSSSELRAILDEALYAFNKTRKETLKLYPTVYEALENLVKMGVIIIGHTEATFPNALFRLRKLEVIDFFSKIYAPRGTVEKLPISVDSNYYSEKKNMFVFLNSEERKPNPHILNRILSDFNINNHDAIYVGDSLAKDVGMAKELGVTAVWLKYGTYYNKNKWDLLVKITHWSEKDVQKEEEIKRIYRNIKPDFTIKQFDELVEIVRSN